MSQICIGCKSKLGSKYQQLFDDRYGYPGRFDMSVCENCGHLKLQASFTGEQLGDLYSNYYPRTLFNIDEWKACAEEKWFTKWIKGAKASSYQWVPPKVRVLDIGCGFGETLGYHKNRGCEVYGVEADLNIQRVADKYGFNVKVGLFNPDDFPENYFDYITLDQVIEHVSEPLKVLQGVFRLLKPGGTLILSTPNAKGWGIKFFGRKWVHWHTPYHLNIFSKKSLSAVASEAGLELEKTFTITNAEWQFYQWIHLATYTQYTVPSSFWSPNAKKAKTIEPKILSKTIGALHLMKVNNIITKFFDLLGIGDNRIYFLKKPL